MKCGFCGEEILGFKRVSDGLIEDSWYLEDGVYKYYEHEGETVKTVRWLQCDKCNTILDEVTSIELINKMEVNKSR